jgi:hypothetical protein
MFCKNVGVFGTPHMTAVPVNIATASSEGTGFVRQSLSLSTFCNARHANVLVEVATEHWILYAPSTLGHWAHDSLFSFFPWAPNMSLPQGFNFMWQCWQMVEIQGFSFSLNCQSLSAIQPIRKCSHGNARARKRVYIQGVSKKFHNFESLYNLFRGHVQCFELS